MVQVLQQRLPVDGELLRAMKALLERLGATHVSASFDVPGTDLEVVVTLRYRDETEG
ncbi:hypothetical protein Pyrde_0002 [Pyrodictium delaneyi]|uniref:Uncharacterized protein n=1 Tax=Pyrodictium delaneyi TaxID=1273541 RepID=A0A0P0N0L9_9CREN|nr:hypothetical protein [Pyrodictium delaneyi]ALL00052.1 hypothetical protein Pyrde_0002 [Pyrodictium delaneyi]